jgi:hypothetical protein
LPYPGADPAIHQVKPTGLAKSLIYKACEPQ